MKKLSNAETELKKSVTYKKTCIRLMNFSVIPLHKKMKFSIEGFFIFCAV